MKFYEDENPTLNDVINWDWGNTRIYIEHCDSFTIKNREPIKGFLSINEELKAINNINNNSKTKIGMIINWARSVIEQKSILAPKEHIKKIIENKIHFGIIFSGTTDKSNNLYGTWSDLHMPPANYESFKNFEKESLMTYEAIKSTLDVCETKFLDLVGLKILAMPENSSLKKRVSLNMDTIKLLDKARREISL